MRASQATESLKSKSISFVQSCLRVIGFIAFVLAIALMDGQAEAAECSTAIATPEARIEVCAVSSSVVLINAQILSNDKSVTASFDLANRRLTSENGGRYWNQLWVSKGSPFITAIDQAALRELDLSDASLMHLAPENMQAIRSLVKFLVGFVPAGTRLEAFDRSTTKDLRLSIPTGRYSPICEFIGKTHEARFSVAKLFKTEVLLVGATETRCRGRCGFGCSALGNLFGESQYTQECFDHDACHDSTGEQLGECSDEFWAASSSYVLAPDCL